MSPDPIELVETSLVDARKALVAWHLARYGRLVGAVGPGATVTDYLALARVLMGSSSDRAPRPAVRVRLATAASLLAGGAVDDAARELAAAEGVTVPEWERWTRDLMRDEARPPLAPYDDSIGIASHALAFPAGGGECLHCARGAS